MWSKINTATVSVGRQLTSRSYTKHSIFRFRPNMWHRDPRVFACVGEDLRLLHECTSQPFPLRNPTN